MVLIGWKGGHAEAGEGRENLVMQGPSSQAVKLGLRDEETGLIYDSNSAGHCGGPEDGGTGHYA